VDKRRNRLRPLKSDQGIPWVGKYGRREALRPKSKLSLLKKILVSDGEDDLCWHVCHHDELGYL
jgi:hypothetical protein